MSIAVHDMQRCINDLDGVRQCIEPIQTLYNAVPTNTGRVDIHGVGPTNLSLLLVKPCVFYTTGSLIETFLHYMPLAKINTFRRRTQRRLSAHHRCYKIGGQTTVTLRPAVQ